MGLNNNTGYTIYFSDRRGEQKDPAAANTKTGSYGFNDFVNPSDPTNGCPNSVLDSGEDLEGDGLFRTYGGVEVAPVPVPATYLLKTLTSANMTPSNTLMWNNASPILGNLIGASYKVGATTYTGGLFANSSCAAANPNRPDVTYGNAQEARENPPAFFRRALKIVDGASLTIGTSWQRNGRTNDRCGKPRLCPRRLQRAGGRWIVGRRERGGSNRRRRRDVLIQQLE